MFANEALSDELTQMILKHLHRRGRSTAGSIAVHLDAEKHRVKYRLDEHLEKFEFVARAGKKELPGNTKDAILYEITERGRKTVELNPDALADPITRREVVEAFDDLAERVEQFQSRVNEAEEEIERMDGLLERRGKRITKWKGRVQDAEQSIETLSSKMNGRRRELDDVQARLQAVEERTAENADRTKDLRAEVEGLDVRVADDFDEKAEQIEDLRRHVSELYDRLEDLDEKIENTGLF